MTLIAPGADEKIVDGVKIIAVPKYSGRIKRMLFTPLQIFLKILEGKYRLIHFHDPELIPLGLLLRLLGKKVIFDIHEAVSVQILAKTWLPFQKQVSIGYRIFERFACRFFDVVLAFSTYEEIYSKIDTRKTIVLNLPDLEMFEAFRNTNRTKCENSLFYIGGVTEGRAILPLIQAIDIVSKEIPDLKFYCVGPIESGLMAKIISLPCYENVEKHIEWKGRMDVLEGYELSKKSKVGVSLLFPQLNYTRALPTKIFEYMAVGLPFITSNFPFFLEQFERHEAGEFVDPKNVKDISVKLIAMLKNNGSLDQMSMNGTKAVQEFYSWESQSDKLIDLYKKIL